MKRKFCICNLHGDRPNRALFVRNGVTLCMRCERPVQLCPQCGGLQEGAKKACAVKACPLTSSPVLPSEELA